MALVFERGQQRLDALEGVFGLGRADTQIGGGGGAQVTPACEQERGQALPSGQVGQLGLEWAGPIEQGEHALGLV